MRIFKRQDQTKAAARRARSLLVATVAALGAALLSACGSTPPIQWLSLPLPSSSVQQGGAQAVIAQAASQPSDVRPVLVVRRVTVPEYMQSASVRYRDRASVLAEWPDVRWADRLEVGLTEHLLMRLRRQLPDWTVCDRQCPVDSAAVALHVDVAPLDYIRAERALKAEARWTFTQRVRGEVQGRDGRLASNRSTQGLRVFDLKASSDDAQGQSAAMGELLDLLAADLAREALAWNGP